MDFKRQSALDDAEEQAYERRQLGLDLGSGENRTIMSKAGEDLINELSDNDADLDLEMEENLD